MKKGILLHEADDDVGFAGEGGLDRAKLSRHGRSISRRCVEQPDAGQAV